MGKLFTTLRRLPRRTSALVAIVLVAVIVPAALFAWGPSRPTFTIKDPADHVTFNSITNNPNIGDERNFVGIRESGTNTLWKDNMPVQPGKDYTVRMYVHNNARDDLHLVAQNVTARFNLPTTTGKSVQIDGSITSSNASPAMVYDDAVFSSDKDFNVAYVPNTLKFENNAFGAAGTALPTSIFDQRGALLGYDKLDGKIPGCFQYAGYVTFQVKPQFAPENKFDMKKEVRKSGETTWQETVATKPGDTVDFQISYKNTGGVRQDNVVVKDVLPAGLTYAAGSTYLKNGTNPNALKISDNITTTTGVNIGDYNPDAAAYVKFSAKVNANDSLPVCGPNKLTNKGQVIVSGGSKEDTADVTVPKECQTVTPKYTCDSLTITKINRTSFSFDTKYTLENATFKSVTYVIRDESGDEITRTSNLNYIQTKVGKYTVEAIVTVTVNGVDKTVSSANCKKPFEVTEIPVTPVYTCDSLTKTKISRTEYHFTGTATAEGGATIVSYTFDFDDGNTSTVASPNDVSHVYANPGTYMVKLSVAIKVNNTDKTVTDATKCAVQVVVSPEECKPGIPMNDIQCVETPPEVPAELPHTGVGDGLVALVGAGSLIAAISYYVASRRTLG